MAGVVLKVESEGIDEKMQKIINGSFVKYDPCLYEKDILCENCPQDKTCDMKMGRLGHFEAYQTGFKEGIKCQV